MGGGGPGSATSGGAASGRAPGAGRAGRETLASLVAGLLLVGGLAACGDPTRLQAAARPSTTAPARPATTTSSSTTTSTVPSATPTTVVAPIAPVPGWSAPLTVLPPGGGFTSVSCLSDTFCIAAGGGENQADAGRTGGAGVTDSWDGATWAEPSVYFPVPTGPAGAPAAPVMPAVSCTLGPECVVVDGTDHVSTGDGTDWSLPAALSPAPPLPANPADPGPGHPGSRRAAVSCSGPAFCAAVDNTGQAAVYKSGRWSPLQHLGAGAGGTGGPGGSALYVGGPVGLACPATDACLAVVGTATFGWDGTSWSPQAPWATAPGAGASGSGLSCPEVSSCWAVGGPLAARWTGGTWSIAAPVDTSGDLDAVSCPTTTFCVAVDTGGSVVVWDGTAWSPPRRVLPAATEYVGDPTSVSCPTAGFCLVLNGDGDYATYTAPPTSAPPS